MHSHDHSHEHGDDHEENHGNNGEIKYWRSIEYKERTPEYIASTKEEFRAGDSEVTGLQRREMLKLMGASIALAGTGVACRRPEEKILPYAHAPEDLIPGVANYFATAKASVFGATGLVVESHENRPTKIEGNKEHPASLGSASSQDQACVLELYDPDRSTSPMKRNERASFEKSTWLAWDEFAAAHAKRNLASQGQGFAIVYPGHGCPTTERLLTEMKAQLPQMQVFAFDPMTEVNTAKGAELAFGPNARVLNEFDKAKVILTVHADPLMKGPAALRNARGFGKGRTVESARISMQMNRLYCVEAEYSVTGTNADHRHRLSVSKGGEFLLALAKELSSQIAIPETLKVQILAKATAKLDDKFIKGLAKDLAGNTSSSLVVVGESQEPWVHALGHAINEGLSNIGQTVQVVKAKGLVGESGFDGLAKLNQALEKKQISTLAVLDVNLAYATPGALRFNEVLKKADMLIHAGSYFDETAKFAHWHLPLSHFLESWGDATAWDGTVSIQQPLIDPLYQTRSIVEILASLQTGTHTKGYEVVQATWRGNLGLLASDKSWRKSVHDGIVAQTAYVNANNTKSDAERITDAIKGVASSSDPTIDNLELLLSFDHRVLDGRLANLGWMQELPDPITKLTWDNALLLSPSLAKKMGLKSGVKDRFYVADVVNLTVNGVSIEVPSFVVPGLAEFTIIAAFGFGRTDAGSLGNNVGYNAYPLWPANGSRVIQNVKLSRTTKTYDLASTQEQFAMNGETIQEISMLSLQNRDPARVSDVSAYQADPNYTDKKAVKDSLKGKDGLPLQMTTPPWEYKGNKWGMVIDLTSCTGCNACVTACQSENNIPVVGKTQVMRSRAMHWIRIDRYFTGDVNEPMAIAQPIPCMHCENAPCEPVCPVAATAHDKEGLNAMTYNRCVGTRYCGNNCPYKVRKFNYLDFSHSGNLYVDEESKKRSRTLSMQMNPDVTVRYRGVMEKCTYCVQRIQEAKILATRNQKDPNALKDGSVTPACAQTCPTQAITFGNLNDEDSLVNKRKAVDRNYDLLDELNVRPRTSYLGKLRNPNPELV